MLSDIIDDEADVRSRQHCFNISNASVCVREERPNDSAAVHLSYTTQNIDRDMIAANVLKIMIAADYAVGERSSLIISSRSSFPILSTRND